MKKIFISAICLVAALSFLTTSCQKDDAIVDLMATIENINDGSKTHINGNYLRWNNGDKVSINGTAYDVTVSDSATTPSARISGVTSAATYYAAYPANIASTSGSTVTLTLPEQQQYATYVDGTQKVNMPMCAKSTGGTLEFHNVCALVKVTVTNNTGGAVTVDKITITSTTANLSGSGSIDLSSSAEQTLSLTSGQKTVSLIGINKALANGADACDFYVVVPALSADLHVQVATSNGTFDRQTSSSATLSRSQVGKLGVSNTHFSAWTGSTNGHEWVKIGDVKWATCNLGATSSTGYGNYYAWGETTGYASGAAKHATDGFASSNYTASGISSDLSGSNDAATVAWGAPWRMPTVADMTALSGACTKTLVTTPGQEGVRLHNAERNLDLFFPSGRDYLGVAIVPAAMSGNAATDYNGDYWLSNISSNPGYAACLGFSLHKQDCSQGTGNHLHFDVLSNGGVRYYGRTIRAVCD